MRAKAAKQKVPAAAGRVDHLEAFEAELVDGRLQRAFEDELLDEDRRLEQGVLLAGGFGEVLVQVAQEAGVPGRVGEIVDDLAGAVGVDLLEELDELLGGVAREPVAVGADRIVRPEDVLRAGQLGQLVKDGQQVVAVGLLGRAS